MLKFISAVFAVVIGSVVVMGTADAKSKASCTRTVKSKEQFLTPGGRCGEDCRAAIDRCVKGQKL